MGANAALILAGVHPIDLLVEERIKKDKDESISRDDLRRKIIET